eukprot:COSAG03_NODE_946_length_5235_cov_80.053933_3_plen_97_part_00
MQARSSRRAPLGISQTNNFAVIPNTQMIKYADATPADHHVGSYQCSNAHVRDRNIEYCTETLKASQVIDYTAQSWWEELGPNSVDVLTPTNDSLEH